MLLAEWGPENYALMRRGPSQTLEAGFHKRTLCHTCGIALFVICIERGAVRRTASIRGSFIQFGELKLTTVDRCSSANCTNEFLIGAVCRTAPIIMHMKGNPASSGPKLFTRPKTDPNIGLPDLLYFMGAPVFQP